MEGWLGGVHLGLNKQWGSFVAGGELSLSGGSVDGSSPCAPNGRASTCEASMDWLALALGRAGFASSNWMLYGTVGFAIAGITSEYSNSTDTVGYARGTTTTTGVAYGAGGEVDVGSGFLLGLEYLRLDFDETRTLTSDDVDDALNSKFEDADVLRARLSIKWGGNG